MNFTTTPPTKPGDYRWRLPVSEPGEYSLTKVEQSDIDEGLSAFFPGGEWCGPLVEPDRFSSEVENAFSEGHSTGYKSTSDAWLDSRARRVVEGEEM